MILTLLQRMMFAAFRASGVQEHATGFTAPIARSGLEVNRKGELA